MTEIIKVDFNSGKIIPLMDPDTVAAIQIYSMLNLTVQETLSKMIENPQLGGKVKKMATYLKGREWSIRFKVDDNG